VLGVIDPSGERTLFVLGPNEHPTLDDPLPWDDLATFDAVFFTGEDPRTLVAARRARVLVVTARRLPALIASGVQADVLIGSASDPGEQFDPADLPVSPHAIVRTEGAAGGSYRTDRGLEGRYRPAPLPGAVADTYGAGDVMMAALTLELGAGRALEEALERAAAAAAAQLTRRGATPPGRA
jgi:ribokinase